MTQISFAFAITFAATSVPTGDYVIGVYPNFILDSTGIQECAPALGFGLISGVGSSRLTADYGY